MKQWFIEKLSSLLYILVKDDLAEAVLMDAKGSFIKPFDLECNEIDLETVGLALSRTMRFFGQTNYSVAQHSVNMAKVLLHRGESKDLARQALLHEVGEAFMGDLVSPIKNAFSLFKKVEESLIEKTFKCYNISYPLDSLVKDLDRKIMIDEAINHMPNKKFWKSLGNPLSSKTNRDSGVDYQAWNSEKAHEEFIALCIELELL